MSVSKTIGKKFIVEYRKFLGLEEAGELSADIQLGLVVGLDIAYKIALKEEQNSY